MLVWRSGFRPISERFVSSPANHIVPFPDTYFKGIAGYNRLMMSPEFYETFAQWEYILIYQTDAWVFSDRLSEWCSKGYDYIGAPWIPKPKYRKLYYRIFNFLKRVFCYISGSSDYSRIHYCTFTTFHFALGQLYHTV